MANGEKDTATSAPLAADIAAAIVAQVVSVENIERIWKGGENSIIAAAKIIVGVLLGSAGAIGAKLAEVIVGAEEVADPAFQRLMQVAFQDITGIDMGGASTAPGARSSRTGAARNLGAALMAAVAGSTPGGGGGGEITPSQAPAEEYVTWVTQLALEGWLMGVLGETITLGQVEALGELDDALAQTIGLGRMTRRVMAPLLDAKVITPFRWHVNKAYRPELLAASDNARQIARGRGNRETWLEDMRRLGYREDQIEAILNNQRRFFGASDVRQFLARGYWTREAALQHLRDQGYDEQAAADALRLEGLRRIESLEGAEGNTLVNAYGNWEIDRATFTGMLADVVTDQAERNLLIELGELRRAVNVKTLSLADVERAAKMGILAPRDYRRALERAGYEPDAVAIKELMLRKELDEKRALEELRAEQAAERAAELERRNQARAEREAALEAERALARRGDEADLEAAAIRGLIPLARVGELYSARYDADTVGVLLELLESKRLEYLERQARAATVEQGAERRGLSVSDVRKAYFANLITLEELRGRLASMGFAGGDVDVLAGTAAADKAASDQARAARDAAAAAATNRGIDLARFEQLVRRGARTLEQYEELLAGLGFNAGARASMRELLALKVADDARARELRAQAAGQVDARGLSLEQMRRAVLLGVRTVDQFSTYLVDQKYNADAQEILLAELRGALQDAEAAAAARREADARRDARAVPLSVVARAAALGVISPDAYAARLVDDGFSPDDVDLQLELLLVEIADVQAARARREALELEAGERGLSLAALERAVKAGAATLEDYRARAAALGYSVEAVDDLVAILSLELAQLADARARRATIGTELAARNLSIGQLEESVTKGFKTLEEFEADVEALGYTVDDAELLAALLAVDLEKTQGGQ